MEKSFKRKQKKINKYVRRINRMLEEDEAFLGRIYLRQFSAGKIEFSDGSGCLWVGVIRIYDKLTNTYTSVLCDSYSIERLLAPELNRFVCEDLQIDTRRAIALHVDYRDVPHNPRDAEPFYPHYEKNYSYKCYVQ